MAARKSFQKYLWLTLAILLLSACSFVSSKSTGRMEKQTYYFNANLKFSVSYPVSWKRVSTPGDAAPDTVAWVPKGHWPATGGPEMLFRVTSRAPTRWKHGTAAMRAAFAAFHPETSLERNKPTTLPAGKGCSFLAHSPKRTFLVYLVSTNERDYILEFSSKPKAFAELRPLFHDIAATFKALH